VRKGDELDIEIEKFADRGKSLARLDGYVVFVPGAVPGDRVKVRIVRKKKKFAEARLLEVLEPSGLRVDPRCEYFGSCGGCKWQHVDYPATR
jgi:23S rRNA (uracil1939-C5)-methyltransferase